MQKVDSNAVVRRWAVAFALVAVCLYGPFAWLLVDPDFGSDHWFTWLRLWPVLPGFVPGALLFHPHDAIEFAAMGVFAAALLAGLTWLGSRGRRALLVAALVALAASIPSALLARAAYLA